MSNRDCLTDNIREDIRATLLQKDTRSSLETPTFTVSDTLTANVAPLLNNDSSSLTTQSQTVPAQSPPRPRKRVIGAHNMGLSVEQWRRVGGARDLDDDTTTPISVPLQPTGMDQPLGQQEVPISNAPPLQQHSSTTNSIVQPPEASPSMEEPRPTFSHLAREYIWSLFGLCLSAPDGAPTTKASNTHAHEVSPRPAGTAKDALEAILEADNRARRRLGLPTTIQRTKPSPNTEVKPNSATVATSTHLSSPFNPGGSGGGGGSVDDENYHPYATDIIVGMAFPVYHNQQNGPNGPDWDWVIRDVAEQRHRKMQARVNQILAFDPHFFEKRDRERQDSLLARAMGGFLPNDATDRALLERVGQTTTAPKLANGPCGVDCQVQCEDQCRYQYNAATTPTSTSVPPTPSMANAMFDSEDECDDQPENESLLAEEEEHGRRHHDETDLTGNSPHMHSLSARSSDDEETDEDESDDDDEPPRPRLDKGKGRAIDDNDPQMSPEPVHYHAQLFQQSTQPAASCSSSSSAVSDHWPHSGQCPHPATCIDCTNNHQSRTETSPQHEANQQDPTNQHTEANPEDDNCGSADPQSDRPLTWMPPECTLTRWRGEPPSRVQRRSREQREQREQRELNALRIFNPIMDRIQQDQQELQKEMQMRIRHVPVQTVQSCVRYSTVDPVAHQALEVCIVDGDQSTAAAAVAEESQQPRAEPKSLYLSVPQRDDGIATPPPKSLLQARARSTIHGMSVQQASAKIRHHSSPPLYLSPSDSSACSYSSSLSTTPSPPYPSPLSSIAGGSSYDDQGPYEPYARDEATRQAIRQAHLDRLDQQKRASWRARRQRLPLLGEEYEMRKRRIAEEAAARAAAAAAAAGQQQQQLQDSIDAQEAPRLREFWTPDAPYEGDDHSYDDERRRSHRSLGKMGTLCRRVASKVATETRRALKKSFSVLSLKRRQSCKEQVKREAAEAAGAAGASTADDAVDMGGHSDDDSIPLGVLLRRNT
ncbi:hypothetical protein BGZ73_003079 [Actinomortierella ambigua]|nr:hypothetical protein BGZ73_003079 [Actinomortierella ambigua]